jgi:agmatine deiminase
MLQKNFALLKSFQNINGEPFRLCPLLLPKNKMYLEGKPLPCTYANFYIGNGFVIVPLYDDPHDSLALSTLTSVFPHHTVLGRSSKEIIKGGGSFHCITQQQPAGNVFWQKGLLP